MNHVQHMVRMYQVFLYPFLTFCVGQGRGCKDRGYLLLEAVLNQKFFIPIVVASDIGPYPSLLAAEKVILTSMSLGGHCEMVATISQLPCPQDGICVEEKSMPEFEVKLRL